MIARIFESLFLIVFHMPKNSLLKHLPPVCQSLADTALVKNHQCGARRLAACSLTRGEVSHTARCEKVKEVEGSRPFCFFFVLGCYSLFYEFVLCAQARCC